MITTKHALLFFVLLSCVLAGIVGYFLLASDKGVPFHVGDSDPTFVSSTGEYTVTTPNNETDRSVRDSIVEKLGTIDSEVEAPSSDEEDVEPDGVVLGDGKISNTPRAGYIYACQQNFNERGATAGPWIDADVWYPDQKPTVDGAVLWENDVLITAANNFKVIASNGLPDHSTGVFPIAMTDDAYQYDRNPNTIRTQELLLELPQYPTVASVPSCLPMGIIGVGLNGVAIFNGLDGMGRDAVAHEIQDSCSGHPERSGEYHYHSESDCLVDNYYEGAASTLLGYALDGFGIFSSIENGITLTNDDLDACHGHTHMIPWNGEIVNTYHYHMTDAYPFTLGCFMGEPVDIGSVGGGFPPPQNN